MRDLGTAAAEGKLLTAACPIVPAEPGMEASETMERLEYASDGPVRIEHLHHLLLETRDLGAAEEFYIGLLGLSVRKRDTHRDGRPLLLTWNGLGLTEGGTGAGGTIEHLAFRVQGVDALAERARSRDVAVVRGPGPGPYGHTVYLLDPDGNEIELFEQAEER